MRNYSANQTIINCAFNKNSAVDQAGGIFNRPYDDASTSTLVNCIVWGNSDGGGRINMGAYGGTAQASKSLTCWNASACAGQPFRDATCDGNAALADLFALKAGFGRSAPWTDPECCADFNRDGAINPADVFILKANYGTTGCSPSTGNQNCPP